jgi:hypothetical protein
MRAGAVGLLLAASATAAPYAVGDRLRPFVLEDQHGVRAEVGYRVRLLLLTRDMDGGRLVKEALAQTSQAELDARDAAYVADVSRMPALVTRLFALPSMRKRAYRILLDRDGTATRDVPSVDGGVTVLRLDGLEVRDLRHVKTPEELRGVVGGGAQ